MKMHCSFLPRKCAGGPEEISAPRNIAFVTDTRVLARAATMAAVIPNTNMIDSCKTEIAYMSVHKCPQSLLSPLGEHTSE